ncbi:DUF3048 domain-containing protein [Brevibacillus humidisoli]|uniref:DUF3048 domain-containing protein n=1 Tax=Brevibacillus humidisoli TaxID=2895522 RepID=UPI001E2D234C|nr:DUF3048 domain-containing protein [Brevibacillus humidisoli]UFJ41028.1 DUF3048 domain-containing protein [Brevibacillus humidisoli]
MKRLKQIVPTLFLTLILAACAQEVTTDPQPTKTPPTPPVQTDVQKEPPLPYTAPFTGLGAEEKIERRPVMVMINNHPKARPQSGLEQADIVYEILAEGEVTRFVAIYQSHKPPVIGPVRSIRPYYIEIGAGFDAVMVHAGGSPEALQTLGRSDYAYINEINNSAYFWREKFRQAPHNLYTSAELIEKAMNDKGMRMTTELPDFPFLPAEAKVIGGEKANQIDVTFHSLYSASYTYDERKEKYLRFTEGEPHIELSTEQQLEVTNLLVLAARHRVLDSEGRRQIDVVGPGDGYLFQQGTARKIKWKRSGGVIRAYQDEGLTQEVPLLPGNTWINIVPDSPGLSAGVSFQ